MSKLTKLFKNPYLFFKDANRNKKELQNIEKVHNPIFAVKINEWKRPFIESWFPGRDFVYIPFKTSDAELRKKWLPLIESKSASEILVWGMNLPDALKNVSAPIQYVEDGFIRSVGLGANHTPPMSLNFDSKTLYFNANEPSDLEDMLLNYDFEKDDALLERSNKAIEKIVENKISKYNHCDDVDIESIYGKKDRKRVLVIGQVEDDASIKYGCNRNITNNDLVKIAYLENPDAEIIYKPHPDVMARKRKELSDPREVENLCQILSEDVALSDSFNTIDHVYTITSQAGFEALLRGIKVTTIGSPFYSGWGLTDDRQLNQRRGRQLSLEMVFAASYILYPKYVNPFTQQNIQIEDVIDLIIRLKNPEIESLSKSRKEQYLCINDSLDSKKILKGVVGGGEWRFLSSEANESSVEDCWNEMIKNNKKSKLVVLNGDATYKLESAKNKTLYIDDGFLSISNLANQPPLSLSLLIDSQAPYYSFKYKSDLDEIIENYDFDKDYSLSAKSGDLISRFLRLKNNEALNYETFSLSDNDVHIKKILVVCDEYSGFNKKSLLDLVHIAFLENPDAEIYYSLLKNELDFNVDEKLDYIAKPVNDDVHLHSVIEKIDCLYTNTSVFGFEALLRNIQVVTFDSPIYSGWGLTDDRDKIKTRNKTLSIENLFASLFILYPCYYNPFTKNKIEVEDAFSISEKLVLAYSKNKLTQ